MTTTEFNIEALPVKIDYVGETVRDNDWKCDQWRVQLTSKAGFWSTDYFTGLGHRTKPDAWGKTKPKRPQVADVLYSLFLDASAADNNFHDWCAEFGYSDDSISALNTYKQCLDVATALRKHFSPDQRQAIQTIISEM
jgi:hypothetical protein